MSCLFPLINCPLNLYTYIFYTQYFQCFTSASCVHSLFPIGQKIFNLIFILSERVNNNLLIVNNNGSLTYQREIIRHAGPTILFKTG